MKKKLGLVIIIAFIASILPDLILNDFIGNTFKWLYLVKFIVLFGIVLETVFIREFKGLSKYCAVLTAAVFMQIVSNLIASSGFWIKTFNKNYFVQNIGSNILLKLISIMPIIILLFVMLKNRQEFYLCKGELSVKADKIGCLGLQGNTVSWGKLSVISALLITAGTILLTVFTAPNISAFKGVEKLIKYLPVIIVFAAANSFCEGILYRNAVMGTLRNILTKDEVVLIAAIFFGIPHYYGIPSGIIGAIMSSILGWYMCRSMYETSGILSSWIIHFMQDTVVFATLCLLGNLI